MIALPVYHEDAREAELPKGAEDDEGDPEGNSLIFQPAGALAGSKARIHAESESSEDRPKDIEDRCTIRCRWTYIY